MRDLDRMEEYLIQSPHGRTKTGAPYWTACTRCAGPTAARSAFCRHCAESLGLLCGGCGALLRCLDESHQLCSGCRQANLSEAAALPGGGEELTRG